MPSPDDFREEAARALPPPHEQEPASLRADIVDELADHLACAYRRELLKTGGDTQRSIQIVRERFGDPGAVARQLWFDAMKGKVMAQRMLVAVSGVLMVACVVLGVLLWRVVDRLEVASADPEWNQTTVRCVSDSEKGPGIAGMTVKLSPGQPNLGPPDETTTNANGMADFGLRRMGVYRIDIQTPWQPVESHENRLNVQPGRPCEQIVVCPSGPLLDTNVTWDVTWPETMPPDGDLWYVAHLRAVVRRKTANDTYWSAGEDDRLIAFHPSGQVIDVVRSAGGDGVPPRVRREIEWLRKANRPRTPNHYWASVEYWMTSAGIFEWNGAPPVAKMLKNAKKMFKWTDHGRISLRAVDDHDATLTWAAVEQLPQAPRFVINEDGDTATNSEAIWSFTVPDFVPLSPGESNVKASRAAILSRY